MAVYHDQNILYRPTWAKTAVFLCKCCINLECRVNAYKKAHKIKKLGVCYSQKTTVNLECRFPVELRSRDTVLITTCVLIFLLNNASKGRLTGLTIGKHCINCVDQYSMKYKYLWLQTMLADSAIAQHIHVAYYFSGYYM